jgi:hypothetical protein
VGSKPLYWSKRIRAWTLKDEATLLRLDKLQEPLPEGSRALEIVNEEGGAIAVGPCWPLSHWKRKYLPGYRPAQEGAKHFIKRHALPSRRLDKHEQDDLYSDVSDEMYGERDTGRISQDQYTALAKEVERRIRLRRKVQEGKAQQFLKRAYPEMRTKMAFHRRRCDQCGDVFSEEESVRYKCERGQCPSCLSRNTVPWGVQEGQAKDFLKGVWQQHVAQTPDGKLIAALQRYGFKRVPGRVPEDPREIWQVKRGTVTHTIQRGGPGTMWFYRRNTVPDYNFASGPINMLRALPRYVGVQESEEQLDFELPYSFKRGAAKRTIKALHQRTMQWKGRSGEVIDSGRKFRLLAGRHLVKAVYVWEEKEGLPRQWNNARLVLEISLPQGAGQYKSWFIQQNWASFSVLCHALRTWRNLEGADLYINGVPSGKIAYRNPRLVELG